MRDERLRRRPNPGLPIRANLLLVAVQAACAVFFAVDVTADLLLYARLGLPVPFSWHLWIEAVAVVALVGAIILEVRLILWLIRRQVVLEHDLAMAGGAVEGVVLSLFEEWRLSGAEQDVGVLVVKGLSIAEIAHIRGTSEATVKSHLNAIYRKSGSNGRSDLLAQILDALMGRSQSTAPAR